MKSEAMKLRQRIKRMYPVNEVSVGYDYWFFKLTNLCLNIFRWDGLPEGLTGRDLEVNLILTGHATIFAKGAKVVTCDSSLYGYDANYSPTDAVYAQPVLGSGNLKIGTNCEVIYNNGLQSNLFYIPSDGGLLTFISRYARMLADIESTINIYTVNRRSSGFPAASSQGVIESVKKFYDAIAEGKRAVVTDTILQDFRNIEQSQPARDGIMDWITARDKILEMFYRDIGIRWKETKRAQVSDDEVEADTQLLIVSSDDMLREREEGAERVNRMFGTNLRPYINPAYDVKEVKRND